MASLCLVWVVLTGAPGEPAAQVVLPQIRAVEAEQCLRPGVHLTVTGSDLGQRGQGWTFEIGGEVLLAETWTSEEVRLRLPREVSSRAVAYGQSPVLRLRSRSGAVLAESAKPMRACPEPSEAGPRMRGFGAEPTRRLSPVTDAMHRPGVEGELLIAVPDLATAEAVQRDVQTLSFEGGLVQELTSLGYVLVHLRFADDATAAEAARILYASHPGARISANRIYRPELGVRKRNGAAFGGRWNRSSRASCGSGLRIGVVDTGFALEHPEIADSRIQARAFNEDRFVDPSLARHGTAVASLLVGASIGRVPAGTVYAAAAFWRRENEIVATTAEILPALDWLLEKRVRVINLSLTGAPDAEVSRALHRAHELGTLVVAAAGNWGSDHPLAFPASLPFVVAVTAVDARLETYRRTPRGADLAARGVDVWVADLDPGQPYAMRTGTSFAVPIVSAALALHPNGLQGVIELATDLGTPGFDEVYGWGLVRTEDLC